MRNVVSLVLGGGRGTRLFPLTKYRSKPAVPLAAKYRLIDIPLSNCINSGIHRNYVLTQFMSVSLHRHIRQAYRFDQFSGGFVEILAAQQTIDKGTDWYEGTADAVRKNLRYIEQPGIEYVLILSGDQLYRMDFRKMLNVHISSDADATIAAMPVSRQDAKSLGVMRLNDGGGVEGFVEKPQTDEEIESVTMPPEWIDAQGIESKGRDCLASMGIYLFKRDVLVDVLKKTTYTDFGKEIFPASIQTHRVQTFMFDDYWEDIGTIKAFYDCNLSLARRDAPFDLCLPEAPVYTRARYLPPTLLSGANVKDSLLSDGCRIAEDAVIENCVIGSRCIVGPGVTIKNSVVMGADEYEHSVELKADADQGIPPIGIGAGSYIDGAILDKNCRIGENVRIVNENNTEECNPSEDCVIRDGIPVVLKEGTVPNNWNLADAC